MLKAELANMRGQGYDGCAANCNEWQVEWSPIYNSTSDSTDTIFPLRYANHRLNLALVHSSGKAIIRNTLTCVNSCSVFLISRIFLVKIHQKLVKKLSKTRHKLVKNSSKTRHKLVKNVNNSSKTHQKLVKTRKNSSKSRQKLAKSSSNPRNNS